MVHLDIKPEVRSELWCIFVAGMLLTDTHLAAGARIFFLSIHCRHTKTAACTARTHMMLLQAWMRW